MKSENIALFDMDGTIVDFDYKMREDINLLKSPEESEIDPWDRSKPYMRERRRTIMTKRLVEIFASIGIWTKAPKRHIGSWFSNTHSHQRSIFKT